MTIKRRVTPADYISMKPVGRYDKTKGPSYIHGDSGHENFECNLLAGIVADAGTGSGARTKAGTAFRECPGYFSRFADRTRRAGIAGAFGAVDCAGQIAGTGA